MAFNIWVLRPSMVTIGLGERLTLARAVLKRFLNIAWVSIIALFASGLFIPEPSSHATYGIVLILKHVTVLVMVAIVAAISVVLFPRLQALVSQPDGATIASKNELLARQSNLLRPIVLLVKVNLTLGIVVLLLTAILRTV